MIKKCDMSLGSLEKPIGTVKCAGCDEIIYRDTIDKDDAWIIVGATDLGWFHSEECAECFVKEKCCG